MDTAQPVFSPSYPPGVSPTHSTFVWASLVFYSCDLAELPALVEEEFQFAVLATLVEPIEGAPDATFTAFVHDAFSNSQPFRDETAAAAGLAVRTMETVEVRHTPLDGDHYREMVEFSFPPEAAEYSVKAALMDGSGQDQCREANIFDAGGTLGNYLLECSFVSSNAQGTVSFGPDSYWRRHSEAPEWGGAFWHQSDFSGTMTFS